MWGIHQSPVNSHQKAFDIFFDLRLNKRIFHWPSANRWVHSDTMSIFIDICAFMAYYNEYLQYKFCCNIFFISMSIPQILPIMWYFWQCFSLYRCHSECRIQVTLCNIGQWLQNIFSSKLPFFKRPLVTTIISLYPARECHLVVSAITSDSGVILGLCQANERRRYKVTSSLIGWAQSLNQSCDWAMRSRSCKSIFK